MKVVYPNGVAKSMRAVEVSKNSSCSSASFDVDATKIIRLSSSYNAPNLRGGLTTPHPWRMIQRIVLG